MLTKDLNNKEISIDICYKKYITNIQWDYDNECFYGNVYKYHINSTVDNFLYCSYQGYTFEEAVEAFKIAVNELLAEYDENDYLEHCNSNNSGYEN